VGLVTGACLAEQGNHVWCVDIDEDKISRLNAGVVPIYEPGLEDIIKRNVSQGRLKFTTDTKEAVKNSFFVFIAVGTPPDGNGNADLKYVLQAAQNIGACMEGNKTFAIWGLSFKPHTDDIREASAIEIIKELTKKGAKVHAFDPVALDNTKPLFEDDQNVCFADDEYNALEGADAVVLVTEWPQFRKPDWERAKELLTEPVVFDGRNQYDSVQMKQMGFEYFGVGRHQQ